MKILFICEPASPHAARWINQFTDTDIEIHVVSEDPTSNFISPDLRIGTVYLPSPAEVPEGVTLITSNSHEFEKHVEFIGRLVESINPDLIHTLGMYVNSSNRCMIMATLKEKIEFFKQFNWVYSSWGMDLDWFAKEGQDREIAKKVAAQVDFYISECERDIKYFNELGYKGKRLEFFPGFGGVTWEMDSVVPLAERNQIVIKARDIADGDVIGRAFSLIPALIDNADILRDFRIIAMQAGPNFKQVAEKLNMELGLNIVCPDRLPKQSDVLDFYRKSRAWFAMTLNDGLPSSLVEAMSLGCLPVHSDLSSIREWVTNDFNGLLPNVEDKKAISEAMRKALTDDAFVTKATEYNLAYVKSHWSDEVIKRKIYSTYEEITQKKIRLVERRPQ